jgi:hypothetical protein
MGKIKTEWLLFGVLASLLIYVVIQQQLFKVEKVIDPIEQVGLRLDSIILLREEEKAQILYAIDSLKSKDTIFVHRQTRIINNYYHENNRINRLSDSGQFELLSKNLSKGLSREREGYYDMPNGGRGAGGK